MKYKNPSNVNIVLKLGYFPNSAQLDIRVKVTAMSDCQIAASNILSFLFKPTVT